VPARARYHQVRIAQVVQETPDAVSLTLEVPRDESDAFAYRAGQFVGVRVTVDGETHLRSYSMSSSPDVDAELRVTVKQIPDGVVSRHLNAAKAGDLIEVTPPSGSFVVKPGGSGDLLAYAAGSGITPIISITRSLLATTSRRVRLLYANRDRDSVIFAVALDELVRQHPDRLVVQHHFDAESGFLDAAAVERFLGEPTPGVEAYLCGPEPFMELVVKALTAAGLSDDAVHLERFVPIEPELPTGAVDELSVTVRMGGKKKTVQHREGASLLQTARFAGFKAPSSCEAGSCATCMARIVEGRAEMRNNEALDDDEVAEGWVLTCQAVPVTDVVVEYE
jgi:3-ketosteroid 9alpha-monooxygenase subunit B